MINKKLLYKMVKQHMINLYGCVINEQMVKHKRDFINACADKWVNANLKDFDTDITTNEMLVAHMVDSILLHLRAATFKHNRLWDWIPKHVTINDFVFHGFFTNDELFYYVADADLINTVEVCRMFLTGECLKEFNSSIYYLIDIEKNIYVADKYLTYFKENINGFIRSFDVGSINMAIEKQLFYPTARRSTMATKYLEQIKSDTDYSNGKNTDYYSVKRMLTNDPLCITNNRERDITNGIINGVLLQWFTNNYEADKYRGYYTDDFITNSIVYSDSYYDCVDNLKNAHKHVFFSNYYNHVFNYCDEYIQSNVYSYINKYFKSKIDIMVVLMSLGLIDMDLSYDFYSFNTLMKSQVIVNRANYQFVDNIINSLSEVEINTLVLYHFDTTLKVLSPKHLIETIYNWS